MAENCNHNCSSCSSNCADRDPKSLLEPQNEYSNIKKVIGVVSGKGGVGKSLVTSLLAASMRNRGANTAVLDADITGPCIPKAFGLKDRVVGDENIMYPVVSAAGTKVISMNLMLPDESTPVLWRGPVIGGVIKQFWNQVAWGDVDYMFVDMPPGTGDVALTVFQSLPVDGIIVVTSPNELVGMIVEKAVRMADMMNIPVVGLVENMSYFECPNCSEKHYIFGESKVAAMADQYNIDAVAQLPIDPRVPAAYDNGEIENVEFEALDTILAKIESL